ncbi:Sodium-coupled neutral amino acid transporter 9-like [Homarus americanus]|uniref:Sodium-coupled neutral amino acid transporter 9-like n=1 Tax=Homarus americanus TaxID=6706 RepID=A0A8J5JD33_HOMAM|nr:Sodium-coupled neutral amino acid transporter 9-like [Homarus americanus]
MRQGVMDKYEGEMSLEGDNEILLNGGDIEEAPTIDFSRDAENKETEDGDGDPNQYRDREGFRIPTSKPVLNLPYNDHNHPVPSASFPRLADEPSIQVLGRPRLDLHLTRQIIDQKGDRSIMLSVAVVQPAVHGPSTAPVTTLTSTPATDITQGYERTIAIWNTMMGTSLMTMPWAFGQAGFAGGLIIMLGMAGLSLYTAIRLLTLQKTMGLEGPSQELSRVCLQLLGGTLGKLTEGLTTQTSCEVKFIAEDSINGEIHNDSNTLLCPPNITLEDLTTGDPSEFHRWWKQDLTVPLYLILPFLFILNLRDAKIFTYFNSLGAISVIVMYLFVVSKAAVWGININFTDPRDDFYVPLFKNFLDNFPPHDVVLAVVRGFLFFQILTVYPLLGFFIRNQLFTYFMGPSYEFKLWRVSILNVCLITLSVLVAILYPNIGFIIRWIGAISGLAYIFMLPCVTYLVALYSQDQLHWYQFVIHFGIILLGIVNFNI